LINNLEFKVVKAIFSVKNNIQIEQMNINESDIIFNAEDIEQTLNTLSKEGFNNSNPLFAAPTMTTNNPKTRSKIRV
jgi:hypothetical protein